MEKYEIAKSILEKYNQEHLLLQYENLKDEKKEYLLKQIVNIDFEQINKLYEDTKKEIEFKEQKIEPISYIEKEELSNEEKERYLKIGADEIKNGKLAVVTMAGGQGTRLGHDGPKGTYILNVEPNPKSLFEILCDNLKEAKKKYDVYIPWYIMTSRENNKQTVDFFEENNYFSYPKSEIKFFIQGELPMVDTDGKILLTEEGVIKEAADGHGGIFEAMFKNDVVDDMKKRNVEWIFVGPIDNPLAKMVDEVLIGLSKEKRVLEAGKSLVKANPGEKVGVFCKKNGRPSVVEYTEITEDMANETDEKGNLVYGESHINCNMFNIKGLDVIGNQKLPYHSAFKKATYLNEQGEVIKPTEPNAYKFESFIFDAFNKLDDMLIFRVKREEEFAPVKNKEGVDSADTAVELYNRYHERENEYGISR